MPYKSTEKIGQAIKRINKKEKYIQVVGFVENTENYYAQSDINILTSRHEGFGMVILESSFFGVPTAVFNNSGFDEIIKNGVDGLIVEDANTTMLADAINDLYNNPKKLISMKANLCF